MFDHQAPRIGAVAPGIPAERRGTGELFENGHRLGEVRSLGGFVHQLVANPAQAVRRNFVAQLPISCHGLGMTLERAGDPEHRQRQPPPFESPQHPPQTGTRAVFEHRLHAHVAHRERGGADDLGEKGLGCRVAVEHAIFGAFLVIENELHGDAGAAGPARMRRGAAITAQVPGVRSEQSVHCRTENTLRRSTRAGLRSSSMSSATTWSRC